MSTPTLVGTYDRALGEAHYLRNEDLHWIDYRYLGDILATLPGIHVRSQSGAGQYNQPVARGQDWREVAVTANGRPLNDPVSGIFNLHYFSPEYADRIEIVTGPRAFLHAFNSTGAAINLVTKNYNSNRPFSKINYSETGYEYRNSDGTFSQNISRRVNLTFGFMHQGTDGRFANSAYEAWNWRAKVRYEPTRRLNIIVSDVLTRTQTQLNGGVDPVTSGPVRSFDPLLATVRNADASDQTHRHDADVTFVGTFFADTANVSTLLLYYSNNVRRYLDEVGSNSVFIASSHRSDWLGLLLTQELRTEVQRFLFGWHVERRRILESPNMSPPRHIVTGSWAKYEHDLPGRVTLAGYGRFDSYRGEKYYGWGADLSASLEWLHPFAGYSVSRRLPNYMELFWTDSTVTRSSTIAAETHRHAEAGAQLNVSDIGSVRAAYFQRIVDDPILILPGAQGAVFNHLFFRNGERTVTEGLETRLSARVWRISLEGTATYVVQRRGGTTLPDLPKMFGAGGAYYWSKHFDDALEIKTGFSGKFQLSSTGMEFNPEVLAYVPSTGPGIGGGATVDFLLVAHIGNAYIHFIWENLTSAKYFATPYYPVLDRLVRIGVSWQFLD